MTSPVSKNASSHQNTQYYQQQRSQVGPSQHFMTHPQMGQVKGYDPNAPSEKQKEEIPYPVYIRPYDDELPAVTWRKNPLENFGTLTIVKGEDKMIVKVPMKDSRILPAAATHPVELGTIVLFLVVAGILWYIV